MDADFHISVLHDHLVRALSQSDSKPRILYLQGDNSAAESKNRYFLCFCALLVHLGLFDEVYYSTMIPGHTHEDIDQLFQAIHVYLSKNSALSYEDLLQSVSKAYSKPPVVVNFKRAYCWKIWFNQFANPMKGHQKLHCFLLKKPTLQQQNQYKISSLPRLFVKQYSTDAQWDGGPEGLGHIIFTSNPIGQPLEKHPKYANFPEIQHNKFHSFMDDKQKAFWQQLLDTSGQCLIPTEAQSTVFDLVPKLQAKKPVEVKKTNKTLLQMSKKIENGHEWKVSMILGQRFNQKTHKTEYHVLWEAGDRTYEPEENFYDSDGVENEAFSQYKLQKKRTRSSAATPSKKPKKM